MKAILQRVKSASVKISKNDQHQVVSEIDFGWLILLGVAETDSGSDALKLAEKCSKWRGLPDHQEVEGKISKSILDLRGSILVVSQFTLYASTKKGRRPSFSDASKGDHARDLYEIFCRSLLEFGVGNVQQGAFGEEMFISSQCWGPITYTLET